MNFLPAWFHESFFNNSLSDYMIALGVWTGLVFLFSFAKRVGVSKLQKAAAKTVNDFDDMLANLLGKIKPIVFIVIALYVASLRLNLDDTIRFIIRQMMVIVVTLQAVIFFQEIAGFGVSRTYKRIKPDDPSGEVISKNIVIVFRWVLWSIAALFVLDNLGINITALVAGIGIGGIAIAMASQAILGDAFSALSIFVDKPFQVGDFIIVGDMLGSVEHVGIKTTRIRSLFGEQLIFSNSDLTSSRIKNYKRMEVRRISFKIGVVYQTSALQVKKIPQLVKEICKKIDNIKLDRVHFSSFGDYALIYEIVYYVLSPDYNIYMDKQQEINFALKDVFEREKIDFAYPTQTVHITKSESKNPV